MATGERQLTLIVPLHAARDNAACTWLRELGDQQVCGNSVEPLATLLTRANTFPVSSPSLQYTLCELFNVQPSGALPVAALNWLADTGRVADKPLLSFDPVSLVADMDHVLLYDSTHFDIEQEEAQQLVAAINNLLQDDGLEVIAPSPQRWYLQGKQSANTRFTPLAEVVGRNILPAMPTGDDAVWWRRLLNEIQMLLHSHPVNDSRVARGLMPINGVWPWGDGAPEQCGRAAFDSCRSDDVFVKGLCLLQKVEHQALPENFATWLENATGGSHLVHLPLVTAESAETLCDRLVVLERDWIAPLAEALQNAALHSCTVYIGGRLGYSVSAAQFRSWWRRVSRRPKTLLHFCRQANVI